MSFYDRVASTPGGRKALAAAKLRRQVIEKLVLAMDASNVSKTELAQRLGVRKSAVGNTLNGDGNLRLNTVAEYLHAMGLELALSLVPEAQMRSTPTTWTRDAVPENWLVGSGAPVGPPVVSRSRVVVPPGSYGDWVA